MSQNDLHHHFPEVKGPERIDESYAEAKRFCDSQPWHMGTNWHALAMVAIVIAFWGALLWFLI